MDLYVKKTAVYFKLFIERGFKVGEMVLKQEKSRFWCKIKFFFFFKCSPGVLEGSSQGCRREKPPSGFYCEWVKSYKTV